MLHQSVLSSIPTEVDFKSSIECQQRSDYHGPSAPPPPPLYLLETAYGSTVASCVSLHRAYNLIDCSRPLEPSLPERLPSENLNMSASLASTAQGMRVSLEAFATVGSL